MALLASCASHPPAGRQEPTPLRSAALARLSTAVQIEGQPQPAWSIEQRMARYDVPGLSMAVLHAGRVDWVASFGRASPDGTPVDDSTLFQAASISKWVAATGLLTLVQHGAVELDTDVNRWLVRWKVPRNAFTEARPVTLRALLSHTAGATVPGFPGYAQGSSLPDLPHILQGAAPANSPPVTIDAMPGSAYRYSGGGYLVAQLLAEDVTGRPFDAWMKDQLLRPLQMEHSTFSPLAPAARPLAAAGHGFRGEPLAGGWNDYPEMAAASLWSTPSDLAHFAIALHQAYLGRPHAFLQQKLAADMFTPMLNETGLGPGVHGEGRSLHVDHWGWSHGFRSYLRLYPESGDGLVIMANADGARTLIDEIVRSVAETYHWPGPHATPVHRAVTLATEQLDRRAGTYHVDEHGFDIELTRHGDHLEVSAPRVDRFAFYPEADDRFFGVEEEQSLQFTPAGDLQLWGLTARLTSPH